MSSDWLDRFARAAGEPVTRRRLLKLAALPALTLGPLAALARVDDARASGPESGDCIECTLTTDARNKADLEFCAGVFAAGVSPILTGSRFSCVDLVFLNWYDGYDHCWRYCKPQGRFGDNYRKANPSLWDRPRKKAPPPEPPPEPKKPKPKKPNPVGRTPGKKPGKKPSNGSASDYCTICSSLKPAGYCLPCGVGDGGFLCCALPPTKSDPNPCCPKGA